MKYLVLAMCLFLSSCAGVGSERYYTPNEVRQAVQTRNVAVAKVISSTFDNHMLLRQAVQMAIGMEIIDEKVYKQVVTELYIADYYTSKAWTLMIEKNEKHALELNVFAEEATKRAEDILVKAIGTERDKRTF